MAIRVCLPRAQRTSVDFLETQQILRDESAAARQLRAGFPWLRFERDLEREFRREQVTTRLAHTRRHLYLGAMLVVAIGLLNRLVLGPGEYTALYLVQFGLLLPLVAGALAITHLPNARRLYPLVAPALAPLVGILVIAVEFKAAQSGVEVLFATVLLTTMFVYFLVGLLFYQGLAANAIVWGVYVAFGIVGGIAESHLIYNSLMLLMTNVVGATVAYGLELEVRTHFLEQRMLAETAARDGLTGIYNRRRFDEHLETVWHMAQREGVTLALLMVDIDFFKRFNDRHGHQAGDECLREVATALARAARRPLDFVARYGGEEFAIVLYDPAREYVHEVATRVHQNIARLAIPHGDSVVSPLVTISAGAAYVAPTLERSSQGFVQFADEALYQAKAEGRNRSVFSEAAYDSLETGSFRASRRAAR
jgi:diguanylate cyclase (GGDEF)-like protein